MHVRATCTKVGVWYKKSPPFVQNVETNRRDAERESGTEGKTETESGRERERERALDAAAATATAGAGAAAAAADAAACSCVFLCFVLCVLFAPMVCQNADDAGSLSGLFCNLQWSQLRVFPL